MELVEADMIEECICEDVDLKDAEQELAIAQDMIKLCAEKGGVGISAPQVGIYKRMFVWMISDTQFQVVFNPRFFPDGKKIKTIEGCLSYPEEEYYLTRYKYIRGVFYSPIMVYTPVETIQIKKMTKRFSGINAIIFQHESQHVGYDNKPGRTIAQIGEILAEDKRVGVIKKKEKFKSMLEKVEI